MDFPNIEVPYLDAIFNETNKRPFSELSAGNLENEEKKKLERERNRIHARNTRARKKAYADELTEKLNSLTKEKEQIEREEAAAAELISARHDNWVKNLRLCMNLRSSLCLDSDKWSDVLAEDFKLILPLTPYRSYCSSDIVNNRRVLLGVDGMIADTASLKVMFDNIGIKSSENDLPVSFEYLLGSDTTENCYFGKNGFMCTFIMRTFDAKAHGALSECETSGLLHVNFNETGLIEELEMCFDGIAMNHQLKLAKGVSEFPSIPNHLSIVLKNENDNIVITTARRPFRITHVNNAWTKLCGFELSECKGSSLSILQGPETDMSKVKDLCEKTEMGLAASMVVTNYNKNGNTFLNHLKCYPVSSDQSGKITHIAGFLKEIPRN
mmetsp:Transcript_6676/g.9327  ORF Transcript_6676/g.9327 Transcript_6676/m.9327 type:complete len:383 (-) Transcript_6676:33-1181(-)